VSRFSIKCGSLEVLQPYGPSLLVTEVVLPHIMEYRYFKVGQYQNLIVAPVNLNHRSHYIVTRLISGVHVTILSQIRDFPFRGLLRLVGSRWMYSIPPPLRFSVTLRLTVSQSVCLGVEPRLGLMTQDLLVFDSCCLVTWRTPSLTRRQVSMSLILLPTVSRPVCPGIKHPSVAYDYICISF
jgi:hypothetical protein